MVKKILHIEYGAAFIFVLFIYMHLEFSLWLFFLLLLVPDVTMVGYIMNTRIGAILYNFGHSLILPIIGCGLSISFLNETVLLLALIWLAHIFMDRCFGYGLKYTNAFKETHLQRV